MGDPNILELQNRLRAFLICRLISVSYLSLLMCFYYPNIAFYDIGYLILGRSNLAFVWVENQRQLRNILRLRLRLERVSQQREQELAIEHVEQYDLDTQLLEIGVVLQVSVSRLAPHPLQHFDEIIICLVCQLHLTHTNIFWTAHNSFRADAPQYPSKNSALQVREHMRPPRFGRLWVSLPEASIVATLDALVSDVCRTSVASCCSLFLPAPMDHLIGKDATVDVLAEGLQVNVELRCLPTCSLMPLRIEVEDDVDNLP